MNEQDFSNLDFYGKLEFMSYICFDVQRGLESIINETFAQDYINQLMDTLIYNFNLFSRDDELNDKDNFGENFKYFSGDMASAMEIAPLIKSKNAHYSFLIKILSSLIDTIEKTLPNNLRLARFLNRLLNCKKEIAEKLDINEDEFANMISKMVNNADCVNDILTNNNEKRQKI